MGGKSYQELVAEISISYDPEDYNNLDDLLDQIQQDYGEVVGYLELDFDAEDERFLDNAALLEEDEDEEDYIPETSTEDNVSRSPIGFRLQQ
jgi:hypothetical protein